MRNKRTKQLCILLTVVLVIILGFSFSIESKHPDYFHDMWIESGEFWSLQIDCSEIYAINGTIEVLQDEDSYHWDQTKYDIWAGAFGVDFYIMNNEQFDNFTNNGICFSVYNKTNVHLFNWSFTVGQSGIYHMICENDSVYRKHVRCGVKIQLQEIQ